MKAIATGASRKYNLKLKELHRIANEGEVVELTEERFKFLSGNNPYGVAFVKAADPAITQTPEVRHVSTTKTTTTNNNVVFTPNETVVHVPTPTPVVDEEPEVVVIKPKKKKATKKVDETKEAE